MIITARLRGLPLAESDLTDLLPLHRDERVLRAFGAEPETDDETRAFLRRKLTHWEEHGFGIWMFRSADGSFVGRCGIHRWRGEVELGYIVLPELWGRGYATEMAHAVADHAFTLSVLATWSPSRRQTTSLRGESWRRSASATSAASWKTKSAMSSTGSLLATSRVVREHLKFRVIPHD